VKRDEFEVTRRSLVDRLGDWNDQRNWQAFFDTYWKLIYSVARRAGLNQTEAEEVVQETIITVAKRAGTLRYDPSLGSFKGWLLHTTRWRIADQFRKRQPDQMRPRGKNETRRTATIERIPDEGAQSIEADWDEEWQRNLLDAALSRLRKKVDAAQYQIFDCYVLRGWSAKKVAAELQVPVAQVYLTKHRIGAQLKKEIRAIERQG
jgi:RNA polymerase sigma factor (sigma-70 family)